MENYAVVTKDETMLLVTEWIGLMMFGLSVRRIWKLTVTVSVTRGIGTITANKCPTSKPTPRLPRREQSRWEEWGMGHSMNVEVLG